jgi:hypothetical protein
MGILELRSVKNSSCTSIKTKDAIWVAMHDRCGGLQPEPPPKGGFSVDVPLFLSLYLCPNVFKIFNIFNKNMNNIFKYIEFLKIN